MNIFQRTIIEARDKLARHIDHQFCHLKEFIMTALQDATAATAAKVDALVAEVATANGKIDALIALAQNAGVSQADIDAITKVGASADAGLTSLQTEEAKVDAAIGAGTPPATGS